MSRLAKTCFFQSLKNPNNKINLPHKKTVYLGRNEETMISDDTALSRKQVSATADYNSFIVVIKVLGTNYSGCNGYALRKGGTYHLKHEDRLELRIGLHEYDVVFDPPPKNDKKDNEETVEPAVINDEDNEETVEPDSKRAKANFSIFNVDKRKDLKVVNTEVLSKKTWESIDGDDVLIYTFLDAQSRTKVAAFDLDGTIIKTKSGSRFAKNSDDWSLNFPEIPQKLKELYDEDYKIVIFTNQAGVKHDPGKVTEFKNKIEGVLSSIKVPMQVFGATTKSIYRKPAPGMWNALCNEKNDGINIDIVESFYVGDAAGREKNWAPKKSKDHSIADRLFAINLGLKFYTPEEYFLGARTVAHIMPNFDPKCITSNNKLPCPANSCEVVIMVGSPGSGKSFYCKEYLVKNGYAYANRDSVGSWQACIKILEKSLKQKQSVVVDNTNADKSMRKRYIEAANQFDVPCRCFLMTTSLQHSKHNNRFRELTDKTHTPVGDVILNMFNKNFEEPTVNEGFLEIVRIDFVPKFDNVEHEKLYKMYLLES